MPYTKVTQEQFESKENEVVHKPTGARFTAYKGIAQPHIVNWGRCGEVLASGEDYDREDVQRVAVTLLARRIKK